MTKIWSAGVQASPLGELLAQRSGAELTHTGQVRVQPFVEFHDLGEGPALFRDGAHAARRPILVP